LPCASAPSAAGSTPHPATSDTRGDNRFQDENTRSFAMRIAVAGATGRVGHHVANVFGERGHEVVPISRSHGVDVITGEGLHTALTGVQTIVDAATGPSPEKDAATAFFVTAADNLHRAGSQAGVGRMVVVSIIGLEHLGGGYNAAKLAHERFVAPFAEIAGPREERLVEAARLLAARRGDPARIEESRNRDDPDAGPTADGALLPGPHATLAGPTFAQWLDSLT